MSARRGLPTARKMRHSQDSVEGLHYVDGLVSRGGETIGRMIETEKIFPNPNQPRKQFGDLDALAASIKVHGILEPILVTRETGGYMIISGERRYRAGRICELTEIPCIIKNMNAQEILEVALVENLQRKDLHPFEEADGLRTLHDKFENTHDQIARKIGKSRSTVTETLQIAQLSPVVREAALEADISTKSKLIEVCKQATEEAQLALIAKIAAGADRDTIRRENKKQKKAKPFVFKYRDPNRIFSFDLKFKKSEVEKEELIGVLEKVLEELRK